MGGQDRRGSLTEKVYRALRDDLMSGVYAPVDRLGEERLAQRYRVSRTPVREALARLLADGLVERHTSGLYPYRTRLDSIDDYYETRVILEVAGLARVADDPLLSHDRSMLLPEIDRWRQLRCAPPDPDAGFVVSDEQFHVVLVASSGNVALAEALAAVNARIRPVRMFDYLTPDRMMMTIDEHIVIGSAVLDGDLVTARSTLLEHIDTSRRVVVERATRAAELARMAIVPSE